MILALVVPLAIIYVTSIAGVMLWGGMDYLILFVPASLHDLMYLILLLLAIDFDDRRKSYLSLVAWFVALLFLVQSFMQVADVRPPGDSGKYDLYLDNMVNGFFISSFIALSAVLIFLRFIRLDEKMIYFFGILVLFLALNLLLTVGEVRNMVNDYLLVYDVSYYLFLYLVVISANGRAGELIRFCVNRLGIKLPHRRLLLS